jgi:hypothetical protein
MRWSRLPFVWLLSIIGLVPMVPALVTVGLAADPIGSTENAQGKHYTKELVFHLPVSLQEKTRSNIRELQLFAKSGNGEWQCREIAPPTQRSFAFKAPADGEYWFTLVTVDAKGMQAPNDLNHLPPGEIIKVVVDTQAPTFDLRPVKMANGEVVLRCLINDANPDPSATKIAYQGADEAMHTLEPKQGMPGVFRVSGPEVFANPLHVTVTDLAGNATSNDVNLQENVAKLWPVPTPQGATTVSTAKAPEAPKSPEVTNVVTTQTTQQNVSVSQGASVNSQSQIADQRAPEQNTSNAAPPAAAPVSGNPSVAKAPDISKTSETTGASSNAPSPEVAHSRSQPTGQISQVSATSLPRQFINTTRASLDYRIDQVGPSGVGKVEVWITSDQGAAWKRHCEDTDLRSPAEFDLPGDGLFGVRVVVTNGNGFGGRPPVPGDQPQMWIEVDTVPPTVQLKEVQPSTNGSTIDLRWTANDKNLASDPISLYFSTRREGPWQPMARGLKNDGTYRWSFPRDMGAQFFVRLEASDMAGNVARCEPTNAIILDMTEPKASVLGVTGMQNAASQPGGTTSR